MSTIIKNFDELATTSNRKIALEIAEAALKSINTKEAMQGSLKLEGDILTVADKSFDLSKFKKIKVVGFGKSSPEAALALEEILGSRINEGAVIGLEKADTKYIETFAGTHPRPSEVNIKAGEKIYEIVRDSSEDDLIIALVSGGGSALLCYPESEYVQGAKLYDAFLGTGKTISEMNTVRKHLSILKGGGLAKVAYPATIIGIIFSDVPGDAFENVASGPTYKDITTTTDAERIIAENNLGQFDLLETPKEDKYFENVHNFVLVSNETPIRAMAEMGKRLGLKTKILSTELYDEVSAALTKIFSAEENNTIILAAGEPSVIVPSNAGKGGRNLHTGLSVLSSKMDLENSVFISLASDGMDNTDAAGAIVDTETLKKAQEMSLSVEDYLARFDSYNFFQKTGDMITTGPTGANVSDLMILLNKK